MEGAESCLELFDFIMGITQVIAKSFHFAHLEREAKFGLPGLLVEGGEKTNQAHQFLKSPPYLHHNGIIAQKELDR